MSEEVREPPFSMRSSVQGGGLIKRLRILAAQKGIIPPSVTLTSDKPPTTPTYVEVSEAETYTQGDLDRMVQVLREDIRRVADLVINEAEIAQLEQRYGDFASKVIVSAQENMEVAPGFSSRLRQNINQLTGTKTKYDETTEFFSSDLLDLSERWQLPLILVRLGNYRFGHYALALKKPEQDASGKWRVLIYDPMEGGESWLELPEEAMKYAFADPRKTNVLLLSNPLAYHGPYDLTVQGDVDFADSPKVIQAKLARVQFDIHNCGPMSLMMAAVRQAFKEGPNDFKTEGIQRLEIDTRIPHPDIEGEILKGVKIRTREEIFRNSSPP
ncbi:hypothetical protein HY408_01065 [Candidatus Gottesmanbacteria bacterium]|nr:hypothetical protein [Candidatus Gottesmanbacteria bacterium]